MQQYCSEYSLPRSWTPPANSTSANKFGLRHVYLLEETNNGKVLLVCHWTNHSVFIEKGAEFQSEWYLPLPQLTYNHHTIKLKKNRSALEFLQKIFHPIVLALASLLVAFEVIFGRYSELFISVPIEVKKQSEVSKFYTGQEIAIPLTVISGSKEEDRKITIEPLKVTEYILEDGVATEADIHNLTSNGLSTELWKENETKTLYIHGGKAALHVDSATKSVYSAEIGLQSKSCYFCSFKEGEMRPLLYEVWSPLDINFKDMQICDGKSVCIVEAVVVAGREQKSGVKVSHLFSADDGISIVNVYSDMEHSFNAWGNPPVRAIWSIDDSLLSFTETGVFLRLESKNRQTLSSQEWMSSMNRLITRTSLHEIN